jgi:effector-binding domain-containing protein
MVTASVTQPGHYAAVQHEGDCREIWEAWERIVATQQFLGMDN